MRLFESYGVPRKEGGDIGIIDYLFLGDFVDRGEQRTASELAAASLSSRVSLCLSVCLSLSRSDATSSPSPPLPGKHSLETVVLLLALKARHLAALPPLRVSSPSRIASPCLGGPPTRCLPCARQPRVSRGEISARARPELG